MKLHFYFPLVVLLLVALVVPCQQAQAQPIQRESDTTNVISGDTMWVAWQKTGTFPTVRTNALLLAILGDTLPGGARASADRIYGLKNGGYYLESDDIPFSGYTLRLVGGSFADLNYPTGRTVPPMLQMTDLKDDGTAYAGHLITASSSLELKNLIISGCTNVNGIQTAYQPITFPANGCSLLVDNCVLTRSNFSLVVITGTGNTVAVTNNKFRNLIESPPTQQWTGRGVSIWADQEEVIIENNTFFNVAAFCFQMEGGSAKVLSFNHNTIVNLGRCVMSGSGDWWQTAYLTNNLIINGYWEGEGYADMHGSGRDVRNINDGLFHIATLPSGYGTQQSRRIVIAKNASYLDPLVIAQYGDSIHRAYFVDPVSLADYAVPYAVGGAAQGHMYVQDTVELSAMPAGWTFDYLRDVDWRKPQADLTGATMVDSMYEFIDQVRAGSLIYTTFFYRPTVGNGDREWPIPENCAYTTGVAELTGTDGLPLGDLNWFPSDKATYLAGRAGFIQQIDNLAGDVIIDTVKDRVEAEIGTVGGTAAVAFTEGLTYYAYTGSGSLTWTFDVPAGKAGDYDSKWLVNETGRGNSGPVLAIDGTTFVDAAHGWGQFVFDQTMGPAIGLPTNEWIWVGISNDTVTPNTVFTLAEGTHTIGVAAGGWGAVNFAEIDLALHGDADTIKLKAPSAVPVLVTPGAVGVTWVASAFQFVNLGTGGTDDITCTTDIDGNYKIRIFGQNTTGAGVPITIAEGANTLATATLPNVAAGTEADVVSPTFALTAGSHTFTLSGADVNIDYIQLIKQDIGLGIDGENGNNPSAYSLEQNFPNPFNPTTTINFSMSKAANVKLNVYNILGQHVATLVNSRLNAGQQTVEFDASRLASGVYFYRLDVGSNFHSVKKMLLLK